MSVSSKNALLFADLCLKAKKYEIAEKIYTRAHDQDPFDLKPLFNLGILYASHLNMPRKALECYQKCLDLDSCNIDVLANISGLYLKVFEPTLSLEFSKKVCRSLLSYLIEELLFLVLTLFLILFFRIC